MAIEIPSIVAIDSMTLVWGLRGQGTEDQCVRAKWLLDQFTSRDIQVILPVPALSEYLTRGDPAKHEAIIAGMEKGFLLRPLDEDAASLAAELFQIGNPLRQKGVALGRTVLRSDTYIIAVARIHGAARIYSNDGPLRDLANKKWADYAVDLPDPPKDLYGQPLK